MKVKRTYKAELEVQVRRGKLLLKAKAERSDQVVKPNLPSSLVHTGFRARLAELPPVTDLNLRIQILPFFHLYQFCGFWE